MKTTRHETTNYKNQTYVNILYAHTSLLLPTMQNVKFTIWSKKRGDVGIAYMFVHTYAQASLLYWQYYLYTYMHERKSFIESLHDLKTNVNKSNHKVFFKSLVISIYINYNINCLLCQKNKKNNNWLFFFYYNDK